MTTSVAIGLGSHDLGVADVTAELYRQSMTPLIVFTGATSRTTRERMPRGEVEHYRERAIELGVPSDAGLVELQAGNTGENIRFSRALPEERGVLVSVLLVSEPYEERRDYATPASCGWTSSSSVRAGPMTLADYVDSIGDARLVVDMLVGALQRLLIYPSSGRPRAPVCSGLHPRRLIGAVSKNLLYACKAPAAHSAARAARRPGLRSCLRPAPARSPAARLTARVDER